MEKRPRSQDREEDGDRRGSRRRKHSGKTLQGRTELAVAETLGARTRTSSTNYRFVTLGRAVKNDARTEECRQRKYSSCDFSAFKDNAAKHQDLCCHVRPEFLKWRRRKRLITREIKRYHAVIICFQEVNCFDDLAILLRKYGFTGIYKARTGEANDGFCHILERKTIRPLLHELSKNWGCIPAVLAGNLNSVPQSAIYEFLASSELDVQLHNRKDICKKVVSFSRVLGHYKTGT